MSVGCLHFGQVSRICLRTLIQLPGAKCWDDTGAYCHGQQTQKAKANVPIIFNKT